MTALAALDPQKSMFEPPAAQVRIELSANESGQYRIALAEMLEERIGVLLDNPV